MLSSELDRLRTFAALNVPHRPMKRIAESRRLLAATPQDTLKELSALYKGLMKKHHPDRFQDTAQKTEAEAQSQKVITAYKFLESIHPETHAKNIEEFEKNLASMIANWRYKGQVLTIVFGNGSEYEFFGVPPKVYNKFTTTDGTVRFLKRNVIGAYAYRKASGAKEVE
jgi:curved DNA-binding protein CbpA